MRAKPAIMVSVPDRPPPARTRPARSTTDPAEPGRYRIDTGKLDVIADRQDSRGRIVIINGVPNSYVHLDDPTRLEYEYTRWLGDLIDVFAEPAAPLRLAHLGGGGCTLPRYVSATRPGSRQIVFEYDAALVEFVRTAFDLRQDRRLRLRVAEARAGLTTMREGSQDLIIRDAFADSQVPDPLTTAEFCAEVARVLAPGGAYAANVADHGTTAAARSEAATMLTVFAQVILIAEPAQLRGRRYGNVILVGTNATLPEEALTRRLASGAVRARLVPTERVRELATGHRPRRDADYGGAPADATEESPADGTADSAAGNLTDGPGDGEPVSARADVPPPAPPSP